MRNGNLLVEVDNRRQAENLLKMKSFHYSKCKIYAYERLNISKGVIKSRELALATEEEMAAALGIQGVTNKSKHQKGRCKSRNRYVHLDFKSAPNF